MAGQGLQGRGVELKPLGLRVQPPDQLRPADLHQRPRRKRGCQINRIRNSLRQRHVRVWQPWRRGRRCVIDDDDGVDDARPDPGDRHLPGVNHLSSHPRPHPGSSKSKI